MDVTTQQKNIEIAQRSKNPMKEVSQHEKYTKGDLKCLISCQHKTDLEAKVIKWAFKLAEKNVGSYYKTCKLGWQPKIKQNDLNKNWARYLLATDIETQKHIAYAMFRFDLDYGSSVLYCYEMQVEENYQRKGLGRFIMELLETIAKAWKMEKIILTILKNNSIASNFYNGLE